MSVDAYFHSERPTPSVGLDEERPGSVIGPNGDELRWGDLPPANTRRWVIRRKAEVVSAVRGGMMSVTEALERYQISEEEFESWIWAFDRHGLRGLRTTLRGERC
ncbi:MAG TPA: DUF1153 domain-containing protein [Caulobacteraceae bacterium]|jgi:hypothetical protein